MQQKIKNPNKNNYQKGSFNWDCHYILDIQIKKTIKKKSISVVKIHSILYWREVYGLTNANIILDSLCTFLPSNGYSQISSTKSEQGRPLGSIWVWDNSRVSMNWGFDDTLKKIGVRDLENHESSTMFERQEAWFLILSYPISFTVLFSSWRQNFVLLSWV